MRTSSPRVALIHSLADATVSELDALDLFAAGDYFTDQWQFEDLRRFLCDLCQGLGRPPVVSDEAVQATVAELKLDSTQTLSKIEFVSYFTYHQERPLRRLEAVAFRRLSSSALMAGRAVVLTLSGREVDEQNRIEVHFALRSILGPMSECLFARCSARSKACILAIFQDPLIYEKALLLKELSEIGTSITAAIPYHKGDVFPDWVGG